MTRQVQSRHWFFNGILMLGVLALLLPWCGRALAIEATTLVPAETMQGEAVRVEEAVSYENGGNDQTTATTTIEYEITPKTSVATEVPFDLENGDIGDTVLKLKHVFNTESGQDPVIQVEAGAGFPTAEDSSGIDAELLLSISEAISSSGKDQIHFNIRGGYQASTASNERDCRYAVVLGYSRDLTPRTTLIADVAREQLLRHGENSNMLEIGVEHSLSRSTLIVTVAGVGLGEESPDFTLRAGLGFRFGGKTRK